MVYLITFVFMLCIGVPIAFVIGITPFIKMLYSGGIPSMVFPQRMFYGATNYMLASIPFFVLAGNLMNSSGLTKRIIRFAQIFVGSITGGLGMVTVIASMFFGGITGSANAECAAIGSIMIPSMKKEGYNLDFSAALIVTASTMGPIIPPSISFVLYGVMAGESIGKLFLAGAIPGVMIGLSLLMVTYFVAKKRNYPRMPRLKSKEAIIVIKDGILALIMPLIILGGIFSGIFTPTESGVIASIYALIIGFFVYKELTLKALFDAVFEAAKLSTMLLLIVSMSSVFSWALAADQIPTKLAELILLLSNNKYLVLLMLNIVMLIMGCILEPTSNLIIFTPIFLAIVKPLGIDTIHFGVIMVLNLTIGLITPPVGMCLFTACGIAKISLERILKPLVPLLAVVIGVLFLVTYIPWLSLYLVNFMK
jgi:C4-dicarboxylate transporter DctM subunit